MDYGRYFTICAYENMHNYAIMIFVFTWHRVFSVCIWQWSNGNIGTAYVLYIIELNEKDDLPLVLGLSLGIGILVILIICILLIGHYCPLYGNFCLTGMP